MTDQNPPPRPRLLWFDTLRGLAMLWIIVFHFTADTGRLVAPTPELVANGLRSLGGFLHLFTAAGYQGVNLFIVLSGAGLAMAATSEPARAFWRRHFRRVLVPYYAAVIIMILGLGAFAVLRAAHHNTSVQFEFTHGLQFASAPMDMPWSKIVASLTIVPRLVAPQLEGSPPPSAWFVVLILQLYLVAPLLLRLLRRWGRPIFLIVCFAVAVIARGAIIAIGPPDAVLHFLATVFLSRLAEFGFGLAIGSSLTTIRPSRWWWALLPGLAVWLVGTANDYSTIIIIASAALLGLSTFAVGLPLAGALSRIRLLTWIGRRSLEVFLIHDLVRYAIGSWPFRQPWTMSWATGFPLYLGAILLCALGFTKLMDAILWRPRRGVAA